MLVLIFKLGFTIELISRCHLLLDMNLPKNYVKADLENGELTELD